MTIENTLERIAQSNERLERLLEQLLDRNHAQQELPLAPAPAPAPAPVVTVPTPAAVPAAAPAPAPVPEAIPAFAVPPAPAAEPALPFNDSKGLIAYCMEKYRTLGPIKGGMIQSILLEMGVSNIAALPAEKYAAFFAKVEAL